ERRNRFLQRDRHVQAGEFRTQVRPCPGEFVLRHAYGHVPEVESGGPERGPVHRWGDAVADRVADQRDGAAGAGAVGVGHRSDSSACMKPGNESATNSMPATCTGPAATSPATAKVMASR